MHAGSRCAPLAGTYVSSTCRAHSLPVKALSKLWYHRQGTEELPVCGGLLQVLETQGYCSCSIWHSLPWKPSCSPETVNLLSCVESSLIKPGMPTSMPFDASQATGVPRMLLAVYRPIMPEGHLVLLPQAPLLERDCTAQCAGVCSWAFTADRSSEEPVSSRHRSSSALFASEMSVAVGLMQNSAITVDVLHVPFSLGLVLLSP